MSTLHSVAALLAVLGAADPGEPPRNERAYDGSAGEIEVATPMMADAEVRVDGRLDEAVWETAAVLQGFTQFDPIEGIAATQQTQVLVFVSGDAIHFGIRAFDSDPGAVRATLAERDELQDSDDYVRIVLDTFNDRRRAYVFAVNPLGVQQDGIWSEGGGGGGRGRFGPPVDYNPDFVWESEGHVVEWGFVTEIRIPFKSLRFPDRDVQAWGLNVVRRIQRNGYEESWAPISRNHANQLEQAGQLQDLRGVDPGLFLELNPVLTGRRLGALDDVTDRLARDDFEADFALNLTYGLTSNLTLDATYNPDFSQVEADAGQIAVNERFALFFPEKRPFFLEGTEIFQLPAQLVYTRSIVSPVAGARLTGKVGSFNIGYLGAVDDVASDLTDSDAVVNLVRVRRDLGSSSTLGLVYTDRTRSTAVYNRVVAADARFVFQRRYTLSLMGGGSATREGEGDLLSGGLWSARVERAGREFSFNAELEDIHPDFRAESGFLRRLGETKLEGRVQRYWYGAPGALLESWGPSFELRTHWDHDAFWNGRGWKESQIELGSRFSFRGNTTLFFNGSRSSFTSLENDYEGLFIRTGAAEPAPFFPDQDLFDGLLSFRTFLSLGSWDRLRGRVRAEWRETPVFDRRLRVPVEVADGWTVDGSFTLFPTASLKAEIGIRHESLNRKRDGSVYSKATIPRVRAQYQFTKSLFLRGIVEYAAQERADLLAPLSGQPLEYCEETCELRVGDDDNDIHVEALLTYEPTPGTVMYIGYSRDMRDTGAFDFRDVTPSADGLFAKIGYRFRF